MQMRCRIPIVLLQMSLYCIFRDMDISLIADVCQTRVHFSTSMYGSMTMLDDKSWCARPPGGA